MRAKYFVLAIALLCLLALPATALAADDGDGGKIDTSVTTVLEATGGDEAVPVIVYTDPGAQAVVEGAVPDGRRDHDPRRLRRRRRVPDRGRDRRARRRRLGRPDRRRQPGVRIRLRELARRHQPHDRPRQGRFARRRRSDRRRRQRRHPRQRRRHDLRPRRPAASSAGRTSSTTRSSRTTTPVTAPSSPA